MQWHVLLLPWQTMLRPHFLRDLHYLIILLLLKNQPHQECRLDRKINLQAKLFSQIDIIHAMFERGAITTEQFEKRRC